MFQENKIANEAAHRSIVRYSRAHHTNEYREDTSRGRYLADEMIRQATSIGFPGILAHVVRDMVDEGSFNDMHIGFFGRILEVAMSAHAITDNGVAQ